MKYQRHWIVLVDALGVSSLLNSSGILVKASLLVEYIEKQHFYINVSKNILYIVLIYECIYVSDSSY